MIIDIVGGGKTETCHGVCLLGDVPIIWWQLSSLDVVLKIMDAFGRNVTLWIEQCIIGLDKVF